MSKVLRAVHVGDGGTVELVEDAGRFVFPSVAGGVAPDAVPRAVIVEPDFGRGVTEHALYAIDGSAPGAKVFGVSDVLQRWRAGSMTLCPVVAHVVAKIAAGNADWSCKQPMLELQYAPSVLVCPILSRTSPPFQHTNVVVFLDEHEALLVDPGSSDLATLDVVLAHLHRLAIAHLYIFITRAQVESCLFAPALFCCVFF